MAEPGQGEAVLGVGVAGRHQGQGEALEAGAGGREVEVEQVGQQSYHTHLQSSNTLFIIQIITNIVPLEHEKRVGELSIAPIALSAKYMPVSSTPSSCIIEVAIFCL